MTAAVVALAIATIVIALLVIAWAVRALFFRDLGDHAAPRREQRDDPATWKRPAAEFLPAPVPEIAHDEYALPQRWHPRPVAVTRVSLPPLTGPALLALAAIAAHLAAIEQARAQAWQAEVLKPFGPWEPWPGDDTLTGMRAIEGGA